MTDRRGAPGTGAGSTTGPNDREVPAEARKLLEEISILKADRQGNVSINKAKLIERLRTLEKTLSDPRILALLVE